MDIKVWLIGKTMPTTQLDEYLAYHGTTKTIDESDALVGYAGKRCYLAFEPGANLNITKVRRDWHEYFENILTSGHGCYDTETEILTSKGWKFFKDITLNDSFASLDRSGTFDYKKAESIINSHYSGKMFCVDSSGVDLLVTPNHRMWVCPTGTKKGRARKDFQILPATSCGGSHAYKKDGLWIGESYLTEDQSAFLGFCIGDGSYCNGKTIKFHLRKERKISWLTNLCARLGYELNAQNNDTYSVTFDDEVAGYIHKIYDENKEKMIPDFLEVANMGLYEGLIQSDGSESRTGTGFYTTSKTLADQFQQLCLHVGLSANMKVQYDRTGAFGTKPVYKLHVVRRNNMPEINKFAGCVGQSYWVDGYDGPVYCVSGLDIVYVRRNGKPVWCGNSVLEHATFNFAIEGLSRVATAELNRHRAGVAISEGSMRYIRTAKLDYWFPDSLRLQDDDPVELRVQKKLTKTVFDQTYKYVEDQLRRLNELWKIDTLDFKEKKKLTSLFRRIIPMGVSTGGIWSFNLRALRHVIALRSEPGVEEEMVHLMNLIIGLAIKETCLLDDFEQVNGFWRPNYRKV